MKEYDSHPLAEIFPLMPNSDIKELADDIKQRGLLNPITLFEGRVLDGRHRQDACIIADVSPRYTQYDGDDPLGFVIAANLKRRHLTTSQKAMVAATIENLPEGRPSKNKNFTNTNKTRPENDANLQISRANAAEALAVSPRSVASASKILDVSPRLAKQVRDDKISLNAAIKEIAASEKEDEPVFDKTGLPVPKPLIALWGRAGEVQKFMSQLSEMRGTLRAAQEAKDELWSGLSYSGALADLGKAYTSVEAAKPYAVCPKCQGKTKDKCVCCKGRGLISQYVWDTTITREEKAMRAKIVEKLAGK